MVRGDQRSCLKSIRSFNPSSHRPTVVGHTDRFRPKWISILSKWLNNWFAGNPVSSSAAPLRYGCCPDGPPIGTVSRQWLRARRRVRASLDNSCRALRRVPDRLPRFDPSAMRHRTIDSQNVGYGNKEIPAVLHLPYLYHSTIHHLPIFHHRLV